MFLKRVQVPDFRVLQDVDISFEPDFFPKIFPLGSLNGGGKSTLLQLIFVLLHCSFDSKKLEFLKNFLYGFGTREDSDERILARFEIWDGKETRKFNFFTCKDSLVQRKIENLNSLHQPNYDFELLFSIPFITKEPLSEISSLENDVAFLEETASNLEGIENNENIESLRLTRQELENLLQLERMKENPKILSISKTLSKSSLSLSDFHAEVKNLQKEIDDQIKRDKINLAALYERQLTIQNVSGKIQEYLHSEKLLFICNYSTKGNEAKEILLCRCENQEIEQGESFLNNLSEKIFLAAPSTQVFLFLSQESRKFLFQEKNTDIADIIPNLLGSIAKAMRNLEDNDKYSFNYSVQLESAKLKLSGFFTYDFFAVNLLISAFKNARDKDFKIAIETGDYGTNYKELLGDLNFLLQNKKININQDLSGVNFKLIKDDEEIELYPEDLSHGELKRLSIYMWLKYNNIEDAIVLMDEIEIAFHPDWQYQIVRDLEEWENSNQYILATHSYELCTALTPDHVKEIEPKLLKPKPIQ
ncbi:MAG: AAA family ATPase [Cyanobacteria bacterium SBLK]|nr:AAA family ATPase [Cyanobacteria bacterium SBLK]